MEFDKYDNELTLSGTMARLKAEGYTEDFNLSVDCIHCQGGKYKLTPDDFKIDKYYRFEAESNPADESILYAISSEKYGIKGLLVNGYGIYADPITNEMIAKLKIH